MKKIQIYGERCSGTNYLEDLINQNCDAIVTSEYGHKHMFNMMAKRKSPDDKAVYVFMYRNPYDWLRSLHMNPHHTSPEYWNLSFADFIRKKPWICDVYEGPGFVKEYDGVIERYDGNVIDLRNNKNSILADMWMTGYSTNIKYEDVRSNPEGTLAALCTTLEIPMKGLFQSVYTTRKEEDGTYKRKVYMKISKNDLDYINTHLDWMHETRIGYHKVMDHDRLDEILSMLYD